MTVDCSQSPIFPCDPRDRARLTVNGGHVDFQSYRVLPEEEYQVYLGGGDGFGGVKMAAINGKTCSISTITWKNRGLRTV